MCRMAGFSFSKKTDISWIFKYVQRMAKEGMEAPHSHGYGYLLLDEKQTLNLFKDIRPIFDVEPIRTEGTLGLIHARLASPGVPVSRNQLHPFYLNGKYFVHNGTIKSAKMDNVYESDSYEYFTKISNFSSFAELVEKLKMFANFEDFTGANFLIVNEIEEALYVGCLFKTKKEYYTLYYKENEDGLVVFSEKYDDSFKSIKNGDVFKVKNGKIEEVSSIYES